MERKKLGRSDLMVAPLCFGGNVFGWTADEKSSFRLLDGLVAAGFDFIDTADVYSAWAPGNKGGESEAIMGNWLKARGGRDKLVIATKVGSEMGPGMKGLKPAYIEKAVEASLKRLQTDYIDLYQSHWDDPETPFEDTLGAYKKLIDAGKVRVIGASNLKADRLAESLAVSAKHGLPRYESLQPEYNLYDRFGFEGPLEDLCAQGGAGRHHLLLPRQRLFVGQVPLEGRPEKSPRGQGVEKYLTPRGLRILDALAEVAADKKAEPAQVAIAWLMARPSVTAPIASATSEAQLKSLVTAAELQLDQASIARLDAASAPDPN